jgi:hypothetical protein
VSAQFFRDEIRSGVVLVEVLVVDEVVPEEEKVVVILVRRL